MFRSLRSRLWLSYALITAIALGVVAVIMLIYIAQNPLIYRQSASKLLAVQTTMLKNKQEWQDLSADNLQQTAERVASNSDVRIAVFDATRKRIVDTGDKSEGKIKLPRLPRLRPSAVLLDSNNVPWIYTLRHLENGRWLLLLSPRPSVPFLTILRDDLFLPVLLAAVAALLLSLLLAFLLSRWVADPLQQMVVAARKFPDRVQPIKVEGPHEVQEVIRSFNDMNERVSKSQQSQRAFVANVSHELKTPLTSIQGFSQAILDGTASDPDARKQAAQIIFDESARMHLMVLELLDLARMDAGTFELKLGTVDISVLLKAVGERFEYQARAAGVMLEVFAGDILAIRGDGERLAQVFNNLTDNAIKFTPAGGSVKITTRTESGQLLVEVRDTGQGIPPDALAHIFDRFYQADPARKGGQRHGAGLGLAIAHEIVQAHHGTITVRSVLGQGSIFLVHLPLASPVENKAA